MMIAYHTFQRLIIYLLILDNVFRLEANLLPGCCGLNSTTYSNVTLFYQKLITIDKRIKSLEQPAWIMIRSPKRWSTCAEGPCRCSQGTRTLSCWRQNLLAIPRRQAVPFDTTIIDLSSNDIEALNKKTFHDLFTLTDLDISYNKLGFLPETIFESLSSLKNLKVRNNLLDGMSGDLLRELSLLETLDLAFNSLTTLDGGLLQGCRNLLAINLASNMLEDIPELLFISNELLEDLTLSGNRLSTLRPFAFRGLVNLRSLDISRNRITHLPSGLFRDTKRLEVLTALNNYLSWIEQDLFSNLPRLSFVDLTANWISRLSGTQFGGSLVELHLGQNRLEELPSLEGALTLRRLFLFSNQIRELRTGCFNKYPALRTVFINNNLVANIDPHVFYALKELVNLRLDSNKLIQIPTSTFKENTNLSSVKLTKNPWHCDCTLWDFARWLKENRDKVWGLEPTCLGPGEFGGRPINEVSYEELCENMSHSEEEVIIEPVLTSLRKYNELAPVRSRP